MRRLFLVCLLANFFAGGAAYAVETLSMEDEADIFGTEAPRSVHTGGAEYIEFYPDGQSEDELDDDYIEGDHASVYGYSHLSGRQANVEERDRPVYVSPFAAYKPVDSRFALLLDSYKAIVDECGGRDDELAESLDRFENLSSFQDVTEILDEEDACYRDVGHLIIDELYQGDEAKWQAFEKKADTMYLKAASVDFNPKYCGENCSVKALVAAQQDRFGDFRQYLYRLIDEAAGFSLAEGQN